MTAPPADQASPPGPYSIADLAAGDGDDGAYAPPVADPPSMRADGDFRAGAVLARSFRIAYGTFAPFAAIAAIAHLPLALCALQLLGIPSTADESETWVYVWLFGGHLAAQVATAGITAGTLARLRGEPARFTACAAVALRRFFPSILVSLLALLCISVGIRLLVVPGIIVWVMTYVAIPVSATERPGILASLNRSANLTKELRLKVFGIAFLHGWIFLLGFALECFGLGFIIGAIQQGVDPWTMKLVLSCASAVIGAVFSVFGGVLCAVTYHDLRQAKEGDQAEDLAQVFA
jgi:hypothetical protein